MLWMTLFECSPQHILVFSTTYICCGDMLWSATTFTDVKLSLTDRTKPGKGKRPSAGASPRGTPLPRRQKFVQHRGSESLRGSRGICFTNLDSRELGIVCIDLCLFLL